MSQGKRTRIFTGIGLLSAMLAVMLLASSCVVGDESELIESLLENTNSLGGELTLVTNDGETYTVTISKGEPQITPGDTDDDDCGDCGDCGPSLSDYLPDLNSEKDVFKTLGLWEQVKPMHEAGAAWADIAGELGYTQETLLQAVRTVIQLDLQEALELDLLSQEKYQYKIGYFGELAEKWVKKIFADVAPTPTAALEDFLPVMENAADIFVLLGITDNVSAVHDSGYTWADIAVEYGYTADTMYAALKKAVEANLHVAKVQGFITYDEYKVKLDYYYSLALKWTGDIFSGTV